MHAIFWFAATNIDKWLIYRCLSCRRALEQEVEYPALVEHPASVHSSISAHAINIIQLDLLDVADYSLSLFVSKRILLLATRKCGFAKPREIS